MLYTEHTVEPDLQSILANINGDSEDSPIIGMKLGKCAYCGNLIEYNDDDAWHAESIW